MERGWVAKWGARFTLALATVAVASALATVAVARVLEPAPASGDPVAFLRTVVAQIAANEYAAVWQTLLPAQQELVPRARYVRCESASPIPGELASLRVLRVQDEQTAVAGIDAPTTARAVTFRIEIADSALRASVAVVHTVHAVRAGERWAWILPAKRLQLDRSPTCGAPTIPR
jgi:hypothetical protein